MKADGAEAITGGPPGHRSRPAIALGGVLMGLLYFVVVVPIGLAMRALGRDRLRLRHREQVSYWIVRQRPGSTDGGLTRPS